MSTKSRLYAVSFGGDRVKVGMTGSFASRKTALEAQTKFRIVDFVASPYLANEDCRLAEAKLTRTLRRVLKPWRGREWFRGEFRLAKRLLVRQFSELAVIDGEWDYQFGKRKDQKC